MPPQSAIEGTVPALREDSHRPQEPQLTRAGFALGCVLFFLSGAAALVYEISWSRQIGLLFGHTIHAAAVVLAGYFTGLAAGYALGSRLVGRVNPLRAYACAEITAAAWACLIPSLLALVQTEAGAALLQSDHPGWQLVLRGGFCLLVLLPATSALGSTLPFMSDFLERGTAHVQSRVVRAYAWNTVGAFAGVVAATGFLLPTLGVGRSSFLAAGVSFLCGAGALGLGRRLSRNGSPTNSLPVAERALAPAEGRTTTGALRPFQPWLILLLAGLSGFGTLALQVLYSRLFSLVFHNSTYTFGTVVAVFLVSLAMGAWLSSFLVRLFSAPLVIAVGCWLGGMLAGISPALFVWITRLEYFTTGDSFLTYLLAASGLVAMIVLPAVTLLGMVLPSLWSAAAPRSKGLAVLVGQSTMVNTLAAAAGSVCASFVLLPWLGLWAAFALLAASFTAAALVVLLHQQRPLFALGAGLTILPVVLLLTAGTGPEQWARLPEREQLIRRWNSAYGWIDVVQVGGPGTLKVRQNLHYRFGATGSNARREFRQAHLPLLLHPAPRTVAFLGLGTGMTAAGAVPHQELESIDVVELIPEVVDATRLLREHNRNIVDDARTRVHVDDARHFLLTSENRFDVIVSDLFVPWESETGYLYTVEQYRLARQRLNPGGVFCLWLALYQLGPGDFELIADSFATVFPHATLWWGEMHSRRPIVALVGTEEPLQLNVNQLNARLEELRTTSTFDDSSLATAARLLELPAGRWMVRNPQWLNTDEFPRIEFQTPLSHRDHRLLHGSTLKAYYDDVLYHLPPVEIIVRPNIAEDAPRERQERSRLRRNRQRFVLFGD
ncbi:MAG: fused MFS/spermidine synthase [Planctomycetaceae bacterium]|nr:fused MFS/spermidine synthase [Planctomycetaceae bacterium]